MSQRLAEMVELLIDCLDISALGRGPLSRRAAATMTCERETSEASAPATGSAAYLFVTPQACSPEQP